LFNAHVREQPLEQLKSAQRLVIAVNVMAIAGMAAR